jgi:hypothetical protein
MLQKNFKRQSVYLGIFMALTGVVHNFAGLMVTRVLLGTFEYAYTTTEM